MEPVTHLVKDAPRAKPHLRLHVSQDDRSWWVSLRHPRDRRYTLESTMNYGDPFSACIAAGWKWKTWSRITRAHTVFCRDRRGTV